MSSVISLAKAQGMLKVSGILGYIPELWNFFKDSHVILIPHQVVNPHYRKSVQEPSLLTSYLCLVTNYNPEHKRFHPILIFAQPHNDF